MIPRSLVRILLTCLLFISYAMAIDNHIRQHHHHYHHHPHNHHHHHHHHSREEKTCPEDVVEWRTRSGEIIFTGTIRKIVTMDESSFYDDHHQDEDEADETSKNGIVGKKDERPTLSALVEVKRVLRGGQALNKLPENGGHVIKSSNLLKVGTKLVVVENLNDHDFCRPFEPVKANDTKIFFTVNSNTGNLRLNSSLVKFSIRNVEIFEVAVKELLYLQKPKNRLYEKSMKMHFVGHSQSERFMDFCRNVTCPGNSSCVLIFNGTQVSARCQCPDHCRSAVVKEEAAVCGADGKNYNRKCELENMNCAEGRNVRVKFPGKCDPCSSFLCQDRQTCVLDHVTRKPLCRCGSSCPMNFDPVCGNDGRTYINECTLKEIACANEEEVWVLYKGECSSGENPCFDHTCGPHESCKVDHSNSPYCTCPSSCPPIYIPICGSDGKTYDSDCHLKMEACLFRVSLFARHPGTCSEALIPTTPDSPVADLCRLHHDCPPGSKCIVKDNLPICDCESCPDEFKPVCGSDGVTYDGECLMNFINCKEKTNITISQHDSCDPCMRKKCHFYSKCVTDANGNVHCVCEHSCTNKSEEKICATDGKTYNSQCLMEQTSCILQKQISISQEGLCDSCDGVVCEYGGMCKEGGCTCDFECEPSDPVCGEDGISYPNACLMRRSTCKRGVKVKVVHPGRCRSVVDRVEESSGSGDSSSDHTIPMCDVTNCKFGGFCAPSIGGGKVCVCKFDCGAVRAPVCGSDGKTYGSECLLRAESCERQYPVDIQSVGLCEGLDFEVCDGNPPLRNPSTDEEYSCHNDVCPPSSYCHKQGNSAKCCLEEIPMKSCIHSTHGCCPDGKTFSRGSNHQGCAPSCQCNPVGSLVMCPLGTDECTCRSGVGGPKCDRCISGFWGFPKIVEGNDGCIPCACSKLGSLRADCDQVTGRCLCKSGALGQKCDLCPSGRKYEMNGCSDGLDPLTSTTTTMASTTTTMASTTSISLNQQKIRVPKDLVVTSTRLPGVVIPSFSGNSYFLFKLPRHFSKSLSVSIKFMPRKEDGVLFYVGHKEGRRRDYYFIALRMGHVIFRYDLGSGPAVLSSPRKVKLGAWHLLEITRYGREGTLKLDNDPQQTGLSRGSLNFLDLEEGLAFVGDVSNRTSHVTQLTGAQEGFYGCIAFLIVKTHEQVITLNFTKSHLEEYSKEISGIGDCGECSKVPCLNEGLCDVDQHGTSNCICPPGFVGSFCEVENSCMSNPCRNEGTCVSMANGTFHCKCRIGLKGNLCEIDMKRHVRYIPITMPEFHKNSYISAKLLDSISLVRSFSVEIWFLSYESTGVLMSATSRDSSSYLVILLRSGVIQVTYRIRRLPETLTSPKLIKANKWNKVLVTMTNGEGLLMVNNDHPVMKHPPLTNKHKDVLDANKWPLLWNLRFGSVHEPLQNVINNVSSLHGAFQRVYINGVRMKDIIQPVTFRNGKTLLRTLSQQHVTQFDGLPCPSSKNPCGPHATCIPILNEHLCRCHERNITLRSCHIGSTPLFFDGDLALSYQTKAEGLRKIQIRFKSEIEDGELFHLRNEMEEFRTFIRKHFLLVDTKLGQRSSMLISNNNISDGIWHKVVMERDHHSIKLYIDGVLADDAKIIIPHDNRDHYQDTNIMWIGGSNSDMNFVGCVESVWLNNKKVDLWKDREQRHLKPKTCV